MRVGLPRATHSRWALTSCEGRSISERDGPWGLARLSRHGETYREVFGYQEPENISCAAFLKLGERFRSSGGTLQKGAGRSYLSGER